MRPYVFFNGINAYAEVPTSSILSPTIITLEATIETTKVDGIGNFIDKDGYTGRNFQLRVIPPLGKVEFIPFFGADPLSVISNVSVTDGKTHHVIATYDGENIKIYIDGVLDKTVAETRTLAMNDQPIYFGRYSKASHIPQDFRGKISNVRIYDRALSDSEVLQNYNSTPVNGFVGQWLMDEGTGSTIYDTSGNENHATLSNTTWEIKLSKITLNLSQKIFNASNVFLPSSQAIVRDDSIILNLKQNVGKKTSSHLKLKQRIFSKENVLLNLDQVLISEGSQDLNLKQQIYNEKNVLLNIGQALILDGARVLNVKQQIYNKKNVLLDLDQTLISDESQSLNLKQQIYSEKNISLKLEQIPVLNKNRILNLKQKIYRHDDKALNLIIKMTGDMISSQLNLKQRIYSKKNILLDLSHIVILEGNRLLNLKQETYIHDHKTIDLIINIADYTIVIGRIKLRGKIDLISQLKGGIDLTYTDQDFSIYSGDTKNLMIEIEGVSDLGGASLVWGARKKQKTTENQILKTSGSGIDINGQEILIKLNPGDTEGLTGDYFHELQLTDGVGNVSTVLVGKMYISPSGVI